MNHGLSDGDLEGNKDKKCKEMVDIVYEKAAEQSRWRWYRHHEWNTCSVPLQPQHVQEVKTRAAAKL